MSYEEMETLISSMKDKLDDTTSAMVSEDLLGMLGSYKGLVDSNAEKDEEIAKLKADKDELLAVNGRLFQKIGFDKEESKEEVEQPQKEEVQIEEIINERGDLI